MNEFILSLPTWLGFATAMVITAVVGLVVYVVSHKFISKYQSHELKDPTSSLFRAVGLLVSLVLFLIVKLSDPFQGDIGVDPTAFEYLVETLRSEIR
jgi:hypothetical protein